MRPAAEPELVIDDRGTCSSRFLCLSLHHPSRFRQKTRLSCHTNFILPAYKLTAETVDAGIAALPSNTFEYG
jgi:hypothetical protein